MMRSFCEVSLSALKHNVNETKKLIPPHTEIMAIVKADAYGHGVLPVVEVLVNCGVRFFAVATLQEALYLKTNGIKEDVLVLGHTMQQDFHLLEKYHIIQTVHQLDYAKQFENYKIRTHLKLDTGMSRLGFDASDIDSIFKALKYLKYNEAIFSHFVFSDSLEKDALVLSQHQIELFEGVKKQLIENGYHFKFHLQNSYGIVNYDLNYDFVRPGIILYGATIPALLNQKIDVKPVLSWFSTVTAIKTIEKGTSVSYGATFVAEKPTTVATIAVGYADGYPRCLSNKGYVLINGHRCNILGKICMDQMMVDVTNVDVKVDDLVVLIGKSGDLVLDANSFAEMANTISYEIFCGISPRVERVYHD